MRFEIEGFGKNDIAFDQNQNGLSYYKSDHDVPQLIVDAELRLVKANYKAREMFHLGTPDMGKPIRSFSCKNQFKELLNYLENLFHTKHDLDKLPRKEVAHYPFQVLPYSMDGEQPYQGMLISVPNFAEMKKRIQSLEKLNQKYRSILYSVSHDLNGPLANIQQLLHEMENAVEENEDNTLLFDLLNLSVLKMKNTISDLMERNLKKGISYQKPDKVNFDLLMEDVELGLHNKIKERGAVITKNFHVSEIFAHNRNIRSILYNLISNAIKYSSPERIPEIKVQTSLSREGIVLSVKDNGIGISSDMQEKIFTKFGRCSHDAEGSGVGLYIVKKMAEELGGSVEVESQLGKGAIFRVYLKNGKY